MSFGAWEAVAAIVAIAGVVKLAESFFEAGRFVGELLRRWGAR